MPTTSDRSTILTVSLLLSDTSIGTRSLTRSGQDGFIEYQDARAFITVARDLSRLIEANLSPEAVQAFEGLEQNLFRSLDPPAPAAPVPPVAVRLLMVTDTLPRSG